MSTEKRRTKPPYPAELRERAVRLGREAERDGQERANADARGAAQRPLSPSGCSLGPPAPTSRPASPAHHRQGASHPFSSNSGPSPGAIATVASANERTRQGVV